jgi:hypothetical protein
MDTSEKRNRGCEDETTSILPKRVFTVKNVLYTEDEIKYMRDNITGNLFNADYSDITSDALNNVFIDFKVLIYVYNKRVNSKFGHISYMNLYVNKIKDYIRCVFIEVSLLKGEFENGIALNLGVDFFIEIIKQVVKLGHSFLGKCDPWFEFWNYQVKNLV